ncbi:protein of unknown function (plasmid) [Cupriavidus taiwanensis]|nr:protein of unknown function [Cupriavidus taiwanensis]
MRARRRGRRQHLCRRGFRHLHRAIGARHLGVRRVGHAGDPGLRFCDGAHHAGRRAGGARGRAFARAGHGDHLRADRPRDPRIDIARIKVVHGDTGLTPFSTGTYASRSLVMSGGAVSRACKALLPRLLKIGAHMLGQPQDAVAFRDGAVAGGDAGTADIARIANAWYINPHLLPPDVDAQGWKSRWLQACRRYRQLHLRHACRGGGSRYRLRPRRDPRLRGGGGLRHHDQPDGVEGRPTAVWRRASAPRCSKPCTTMAMASRWRRRWRTTCCRADRDPVDPHPSFRDAVTAYGVRRQGDGRGRAIAPPAAIFNAVNDALRDFGVELKETPLTPRKLLEALDAAEADAHNRKAA